MRHYYINDTDDEYCRVYLQEPQDFAKIGYLLLQGPFDGTDLSSVVPEDAPIVDEYLDDKIASERARERERFLTYVRDQPSYAVNSFHRDTGLDSYDIDADPENAFREWAADNAKSTWRNDDGSWDTSRLARLAISNAQFREYFEYLGRWQDAEVRIATSGSQVTGDDITADVREEMGEVLPNRFTSDGTQIATPDAVVTVADGDAKADTPQTDLSTFTGDSR